ncbi:hypothetical protein CFC21_081119 [Triticum aestivum]|uniref:Uncharacterized protein n=4 Tax=Triticinae TaxID=1648030 RepID=A0A453MK43_AEGTS|nr:disease resistance protein RGA4 [Aegilops tauschii subsp. strangulata]XP_044400491.1 disease resistance protein RGA4-like [Triticum aestivum]KAF7076481.1 hypothetical protein CFC21_081119 [Triticum aestivum]
MALILPIINTVLKGIVLVSKLGNATTRLDAKIQSGLGSISRELVMIRSAILEDKCQEMQNLELVYDIEDFIDHLRVPGKIAGGVLSAAGADPRHGLIEKINIFREDLKSVIKRESEQPKKISESTQESQSGASPSSCYTPEKDLVGFPETKDDFLKRLCSPSDEELRVISIVGCSGLGKTALARAVYEDHTSSSFQCKAWVVMPEYKYGKDLSITIVQNLRKTVEDILQRILQQVRSSLDVREDRSVPSASNGTDPASGASTAEALRSLLMKKRYLVCIDDVQQKEVWDEIEAVLPENYMGSRILVTTNVHSIAKACSSGSYVYRMQYLDRPNSEKLLWSKALRPSQEPSNAVAHSSESILVKCDGLPLALASVGKYLKGAEQLESKCEHVGRTLGDFLAGDGTYFYFAEIRRALFRCYDNLQDYSHKNCLLYASMFPRGHPINIESLARRLVAEELVDKDVDRGIAEALGFTSRCLEELINQSMIERERVLVDKDVQRYKLQSIILEFSMEMSLSKNFFSLIDEHWTIRNKGGRVRRLVTVQSRSSTEDGSSGVPSDIDLSTVRSLTILKRNLVKRAPGYFKDCNVLRMVDLEGCTGLDNGVVDDICGLVLLNYLGLRRTDVDKLPKDVGNLKHLQTLDIRETRVQSLAMEVIMLPGLAYLFGKFELQKLTDGGVKFRLVKFLSRESKLHTLSGALMNGARSHDVLLVIEHARMLKNVKLWCKNTQDGQAPNQLGKRKKFPCGAGQSSSVGAPDSADPDSVGRILRLLQKRSIGLESLSIDSNGVSNGFLSFLQPASTITSLKLRRGSGTLPDNAVLDQVRNLNKLHLFSAGRSIQELAEALQRLPCLVHLKLAEKESQLWDGNFHVEASGFNSLIWLCFQAKKHPRISTENGGMKHLASLLLLCPESPPPETDGANYQKKQKRFQLFPRIEEEEEEDGIMEDLDPHALLCPHCPHVQMKEPRVGIEEKVGVKGISFLKNLNEVILHHSAPTTILEAWKRAANLHTNKPYVKKQPIGDALILKL